MTPFSTINGKKIDLNLQEHRDVIVKRNKILEKATKGGLENSAYSVEIVTTVKLYCLKCGTPVKKFKSIEVEPEETEYVDVDANMPSLICPECSMKYNFNYHQSNYYPKLNSKKLKPLKV